MDFEDFGRQQWQHVSNGAGLTIGVGMYAHQNLGQVGTVGLKGMGMATVW